MPEGSNTEYTCPFCGMLVKDGTYLEVGQECKTQEQAKNCWLNNEQDEE
jgi:hypothetical protein